MASDARRQLFSTDPMNNGRDLRSTASPASKMKRHVTVRPKALFNAVLAVAGLPEVKYKTYTRRNGRFGATVYFWPSQSRSSAAANHMTLHGEPAVDADEAMQNATTLCLEHLQGTMDIEFDWPQVQKMKTEKKYLSSSVAEKDRQIKDLKTKVNKKNLQIRGLGRGWGSLAEDVLGSVGRIDKMAVNYLHTGSSPLKGDMAWDCYHLTQEADNLCYLSALSTDAVKAVGDYPYDTESDCSEYDEFPGYYPSDHENNNSGYCSSGYCSSEYELW